MELVESQTEYLKVLISERVNGLHSSVRWSRQLYYVSAMSVIVLSAVITVVTGISFLNDNWPKILVLVLSASVTVISAWGAFFSPKESWLLTEDTLNKLKALQTHLDFALRASSSEENNSELVSHAFDEYQKILAEYNHKWREIREKGGST